jgi:hypothetical protein
MSARLQGFLVVTAVIGLYAVACGTDVYRFGVATAPAVLAAEYGKPNAKIIQVPLTDPNTHGLGSSLSGIQVLGSGWLGPFRGVVGWYANLLFAPALILFLFGKFRVSCGLALGAFAIGSTSMLVEYYPWGNLKDGGEVHINSFGIGLYLWLASFMVLAVGAFGARFLSLRPALNANPQAGVIGLRSS